MATSGWRLEPDSEVLIGAPWLDNPQGRASLAEDAAWISQPPEFSCQTTAVWVGPHAMWGWSWLPASAKLVTGTVAPTSLDMGLATSLTLT